jgi:hypothetical protein
MCLGCCLVCCLSLAQTPELCGLLVRLWLVRLELVPALGTCCKAAHAVQQPGLPCVWHTTAVYLSARLGVGTSALPLRKLHKAVDSAAASGVASELYIVRCTPLSVCCILHTVCAEHQPGFPRCAFFCIGPVSFVHSMLLHRRPGCKGIAACSYTAAMPLQLYSALFLPAGTQLQIAECSASACLLHRFMFAAHPSGQEQMAAVSGHSCCTKYMHLLIVPASSFVAGRERAYS